MTLWLTDSAKMWPTFLGEKQEHFLMNTSADHQLELVSLATLTTKGEEDRLEPGKSISSAAYREDSPTGHPQGLAGLFFSSLPLERQTNAFAWRMFMVCLPASWGPSMVWEYFVVSAREGEKVGRQMPPLMGDVGKLSCWRCLAKILVAALTVALGMPFITDGATCHQPSAITICFYIFQCQLQAVFALMGIG